MILFLNLGRGRDRQKSCITTTSTWIRSKIRPSSWGMCILNILVSFFSNSFTFIDKPGNSEQFCTDQKVNYHHVRLYTLIWFAKFSAKTVLMATLLQNNSNLNELEYSRHLKASKIEKRSKKILKAKQRPEVEKSKFSYCFGLFKINWK